MNILETFEELDALAEAFNGTYKSVYLNLDTTTREESAREYKKKLTDYVKINERGQLQPTRTGAGFYILDYTAFHKAYDKDLDSLNLLSCFNADGTLGPRATWQNILTINTNSIEAKSEAYKRLRELWELIHNEGGGKLFDVYYPGLDMHRRATKTVAEIEELQAAAQKQHEADLKATESSMDDKLVILNNNLQKAFNSLNSDIIDSFYTYHDSELTPSITVEKNTRLYNFGGDIYYTFELLIPGFETVYIGDGTDIEKFDEAWFKSTLSAILTKQALDIKIAERLSGVEVVKETFKNVAGNINQDLICFFINLNTQELYKCDQYFKVLDKSENLVPPDKLAEAALIFVKYSKENSIYAMPPVTIPGGMSANTLVHSFCSWASDCESISEIAALVPDLINDPPNNKNDDHIGAYGDFEEYSTPDHANMKNNGIVYEGLDKWALQEVLEVSFLSPYLIPEYEKPDKWNQVVKQIKDASRRRQEFTLQFR